MCPHIRISASVLNRRHETSLSYVRCHRAARPACTKFDSAVGDTIGGRDLPAPLDTPALPRPTLAVTFGANVSPLAGKDGTKRTATMIRTRLMQEAENNVAIRVMQVRISATGRA